MPYYGWSNVSSLLKNGSASLSYPIWSSDQDSHFITYIVNIFIHYKPWYDDIQDALDGPIIKPYDPNDFITEDLPIYKSCYINKYWEFSEPVNITELDLRGYDK